MELSTDDINAICPPFSYNMGYISERDKRILDSIFDNMIRYPSGSNSLTEEVAAFDPSEFKKLLDVKE